LADLRELFLDLSEAGHGGNRHHRYVITDQNGLAATSTRTVIVEPAAAPSIALMHRPHLPCPALALFFASQIGKALWSSSA
jgi:hypothetical protein